MVTNIQWDFKRGEDATLILVGVDTTDPTGWALLFTFVAFDGATTATFTATPTISGPNLEGKFTLTVTLTRAQTLTLLTPSVDGYSKEYTWDVWRTSVGAFNTPLADGQSVVSSPARLAA
jgi:hypothetical protein